MSGDRSPSVSDADMVLSSPILHHASSEPSLAEGNKPDNAIKTLLASNVSRLRKRKLSSADEKLDNFMAEMRKMFTDFKDQENSKYDKLYSAVEEIRLSVEFSAQKYEALKTQVEKLEVLRQDNLESIKALENRLEGFERSSRSTCIEIRNVPSTPSEPKLTLINTVIKIGKALNMDIRINDIKDIFRIKTKDPAARTIIVDLTSVLMKEKIIGMFRQFNKMGSRLTTEHLKISGPAKPVFISENLSHKMKRLFFLARDFAKVNQYRFCWVSGGSIFLRKAEGASLIRVNSEADLTNCQNIK